MVAGAQIPASIIESPVTGISIVREGWRTNKASIAYSPPLSTLTLLGLPQERLNCDVIPNDAVRAAQTRPVLSVRWNGTTTAQHARDLEPTYGWSSSPDDRMRSV